MVRPDQFSRDRPPPIANRRTLPLVKYVAGATVSLFKKTAWSQLEEVNRSSLAPWEGHKLVGVEGSPVSVCGVSNLQLDIADTTLVCYIYLVHIV